MTISRQSIEFILKVTDRFFGEHAFLVAGNVDQFGVTHWKAFIDANRIDGDAFFT
jgi:hypothetical protein